MTDEAAVQRWSAYVGQLTSALAAGRRADALELFMRLAGSPDEEIAAARGSELWPGLEALAPTLAYDAACLGDGRPPVDRLATISQPTLVGTGGTVDLRMPGMPAGFFDDAADAIVAAVPRAVRRVVEGQAHVADPAVLAAVLDEFFTR